MLMALVANYMKRLKHILQHRYLLKVITLFFLFIVILYTQLVDKKSNYYNYNEKSFTGIVYRIKIRNDKTIIYIKAKEKLIVETYKEIQNIKLGDTIYVTGTLSVPHNNTIPNTFNYSNYLYNNGIYYIIKADSIKKIANNTNVIIYLKEKVLKRIDNVPISGNYLKLFILGDNSFLDEEIITSYQTNGISHLFCVSGMHISLFAGIFLYILKHISYNNYFNYSIIILFLFFYSSLVGLTPSVLRSLVMYILFAMNKIFNLKIPKINIMCLVLIILLIINPFLIYHMSFEYSYIISFSLVLFSYKIKKIKNKYFKLLYISYLAFMVSIPISLYYFYQINILSIFLNIIYIPLISSIIFPLTLITFIIPKISYLTNAFVTVVEAISLFISKYQIGIISFPKPSILFIIILYIIIFMFLFNNKLLIVFPTLIIYKNSIHFNSNYIITYLDVGQGDSTVIKMPFNKSNILIDTGGITGSNYNLSLKKTIPYLKSKGIPSINYLILTHGDYDHMGEAINLVNNFKVEKVIFNCGEFNDLEKELIKVLDKKKIKYYSCIKELNIDNNKLFFLQTKEYNNENDNSNVIYTKLNGYKFLFMGDAGVDKEKDILGKYIITDIDVLKVGHHGSKTSSSKEFIDEINPKYGVISVGKNNKYGHPNKEVLNNLEDSKIYRTDQNGSIMFKIKNNKLTINNYNP